MCPFLEENDDGIEGEPFSKSGFERGMISGFLKNDRKYLFIGGTSVAIVIGSMIWLISSNLTPINLDELPVIQAEKTPIKEKPLANKEVAHQDKIIYDNISGDQRPIIEKIADQPENVLNIPEVDVSESLSEEDKKDIIRAFDELAPEKEYKINYIKDDQPIDEVNISERAYDFAGISHEENMRLRKLKNKAQLTLEESKELATLTQKIANSYKTDINEPQVLPPIKKITKEKKKKRLKDLVAEKAFKNNLAKTAEFSRKGTIMVQIASVQTRAAAESEYNRLVSRNRFLKGKGKKIFKVDLGKLKGIRYRIQVGPFKDKEEAKKIISAMHANGYAAYISR